MSKLSARDFKNFTEMVAWQEIVATVKERLNMIRNDLELGYEDVPTKDGTDRRKLSLEDIKFMQGEASSLRYVISLPEVLMELAKEDELKEEKNARS